MNADAKLKEALTSQINYWLGRSADDIRVAVKGNVVTLEGRVPAHADKKACAEIARRVGGVAEVVDKIVVQTSRFLECQRKLFPYRAYHHRTAFCHGSNHAKSVTGRKLQKAWCGRPAKIQSPKTSRHP
jgi:hypothetical protein